ncbi:MAG: META domain-containing protein [Methanomassiliicoccales archaeon]|nr:META domain-containing protein [Methanomassiliicoccales archaeon]
MYVNGPAGLLDTKWHLLSIVLEGTAIDDVEEAGANITLGSNRRAFGRGGCNQFFGGYKLDEEGIRIGPLASTLMYCEETMAVEGAFFKALGVVRKLHLEEDAMEMWSEDGATTLLFRKGIDQ